MTKPSNFYLEPQDVVFLDGDGNPVELTLEEALEFIDEDELVEIVPDDIRLRKKILNELERRKYMNRRGM